MKRKSNAVRRIQFQHFAPLKLPPVCVFLENPPARFCFKDQAFDSRTADRVRAYGQPSGDLVHEPEILFFGIPRHRDLTHYRREFFVTAGIGHVRLVFFFGGAGSAAA